MSGPHATHAQPSRDGLGRLVAGVVGEAGSTICIACCHALPNRMALVARVGAELARGDHKTLIVDADHLDPEMHLQYGESATPGLAQLQNGSATADPVVPREVESGLWLLPSGLPRPSATTLVGSAATRAALQELGNEYGAVIVVTPPLLSDASGAVACSGADAAILAVHKGVTRKVAVAAAAELIRASGTPLAGVVIVT